MSSTTAPATQPLDPHSYASRSSVRVHHLALNLTVDFDQRTLAGTATWQLTSLGASTELVLDSRDLTIKSVHVLDATGQPTPAMFTLDATDAVLGQALRVALPAGTTAVRIAYRTAPTAAALQWLAPAQTAGTQPFLFTQSQAILARTWLPCQDSPGIRFTYEATVRVPTHLLALMSAENPQQLNSSGEYLFRMGPSPFRPT